MIYAALNKIAAEEAFNTILRVKGLPTYDFSEVNKRRQDYAKLVEMGIL